VTSLLERLNERNRRVSELGRYEEKLELKARDPIGFELLYSKIVQSVTSAHEVARLVSASPMSRELGEIIFGLYTPEGDAVALSRGLLIHVHTMSRMIKWMIEHGYEEDPGFAEGDYYFNNDPYIGGAHCPDQMIVTPIWWEGELVAWAGGLTHTPETGGSEPGGFIPFARSRFDEGLFLPCVKIAEHDRIKRDLEVLVEMGIRSPIFWLTDNRAKITGTQMIREEVKVLFRQFGVEHFAKACREYIEDTRLAAEQRVRKVLHPGTYREIGWRGSVMPGKETLLHGPVELTVARSGRLVLDFEGMSPAGKHPFQGTLPTIEGLVMNVVIQHLFYDLKHNEGVLLAVDLKVPEGSAGNPPSIFYPTALWGIAYGAGLAAGQAISRAYYADGYREEVHATSALSTAYTAGGLDQYGRPFGAHNFEFAAAGLYATAVMDGLDTAGVEFNPEGEMGDAEIWEQMLPPIYLAREIHVDGGGYGKYRGGNGVLSLYMVWGTKDIDIGGFGAAPIYSAPGLMGGYPAGALYMWVGSHTDMRQSIAERRPIPGGEGVDPERPDFVRMIRGRWELIPGHNRVGQPAREGDLFTAMTGDGGGFGDPIEREPELVRKDLGNGVTTAWTARHVYCVAIDATTLEIDREETEKLRQAKRKERKRLGTPAIQYKSRERERVLRGELPVPTARMYHAVLGASAEFRREFLRFWDLPETWKMHDPDQEEEVVAS
jgi:N-methylhydantoinase B/oxoprolinase/acetone carboxylase alpha subunit